MGKHDGVHETHCCWYHGCKYCDPDCVVVTGVVKQAYSCEDCDNEKWEKIPPQELRVIDDAVWEQLKKWHNDDKQGVVDWLVSQNNLTYVFWFVGKLGREAGSVWEFIKLYEEKRGMV